MNNFYLVKSGTLKRKDSSVVYITEDDEHLIPIEQIDSLFCLGEINLNKRVLELLNKFGIEILFFNYYGTLIGRFSPVNPKTGNIFFEQAHCYESAQHRLFVAKAIQKASLHNSLCLLKYYGKKKEYNLDSQIEKLEMAILELDTVESIEELLLHEARGKKIYYSGFDTILNKSLFRFERRETQPPLNEFNSMMSFGYHLLYGVVLKELDMSRLYPEIAFIHSDIRSGPSLHYDFADIYKPFIIDRMIFRMIRRRQLSIDDFENRNPGIYFTNEGKRKFVAEFNEEMKKVIEYEERPRSRTSIIRRDIHKLIHYLEGKEPLLEFFKAKW
ncbi:CRISPR-associated endonuclease Cas1 [Ileibacterium valens]|uniref:CRISPR-associated endonuclease Cas1 n=2 Tax=Ileibacterium valens TaxID=1862668 RepID=UPI0025731A24|nr:CRISPR-associated endonuclease Cas1 [Ileibacterium valens]